MELRGSKSEQVDFNMEIGVSKIQAWKQIWSLRNSDIIEKSMWGTEGWQLIEAIIRGISRTSEDIGKLVHEVQADGESQSGSQWKKSVRILFQVNYDDPHLGEFHRLTSSLTKAIDTLWKQSELIFDGIHGALQDDSGILQRESLLISALQSRGGCLELYNLSFHELKDCSLGIDMMNTATRCSLSRYQVKTFYFHASNQCLRCPGFAIQ